MSTKHKISKRPKESYQDIVAKDVTGAPDFLSHAHSPEIGTDPISVERYWSPEFFQKENQHLWPRVWQMACLIDDIPERGDCFHYEISDRSLIIVNTENGIKAYYNSCLHRGRKLISNHCNKKEFVCPFHAITWSLDGKITNNPIAWDLPQWNDENSRLPEARVASWGGFIFICMDDDAPNFETLAAPLIEHFQPYGWDNRYRAWWFEKHIPANWKTAQETFMESHHSQTTHPQLLSSIADINSQYDFLNAFVTRHISAGATASPSLDPYPDEHEKLRLMKKRGDHRVAGIELDDLPDNFSARTHLGEHARQSMGEALGTDLSQAKDAEVLDYLLYAVFPNMAFWAGYGPKLVYRWRPEAGNPEGCIMDIMFMEQLPEGQEKPKPARKIKLDYDDKMASQTEGADSLKKVFDQDFSNIPHIQTGMKSTKSGVVHFTEYTEKRIRYLHQFIDQHIETGENGAAPPGLEMPD